MPEKRDLLEAELNALREQVTALEIRLQECVEHDQHDQIDELESHIHAVETRFTGLRVFLKELFAS